MANTTLELLGATDVAQSPEGEKYMTFLGDGIAKPGDAVGVLSTSKVVQSDAGAVENFLGFLCRHYGTAADTAITDGTPCRVLIPQSGHIYAIHIEDPAGSEYEGTPYQLSNTAGAFEAAAAVNTAGVFCRLYKPVANGDTYAYVLWL